MMCTRREMIFGDSQDFSAEHVVHGDLSHVHRVGDQKRLSNIHQLMSQDWEIA